MSILSVGMISMFGNIPRACDHSENFILFALSGLALVIMPLDKSHVARFNSSRYAASEREVMPMVLSVGALFARVIHHRPCNVFTLDV